MDFTKISAKQLLSYPKTGKMLTIKFYEQYVGRQIQMDTLFWKPVESQELIPILCIVDAATRYTRFFLQDRKNDRVSEFLKEFIKDLFIRYKKGRTKEFIHIETDGARELVPKFKEIFNRKVTHKVSPNINKAMLAEVAIRRLRKVFRDIEANLEMHYLKSGKLIKIDRKTLPDYIKQAEEILNKTAGVRKKPKLPKIKMKQEFKLGDPVFIINMNKYFPYQLGLSNLYKTSYDRPYETTPYYISKVIEMQGIYKYQVRDYLSGESVKYNLYTEQIQHIDPRIAANYIKNWISMENKKNKK